MNREFFEHVCSFAGLEKNENNIFIDHLSSTAFSLKNDGIHILGRMNSELINILNNEISIIDHNSNDFNNKDDWRIVELKLTAPTIIGTVNLIKIIEIIKRYYLNFQETSINNHYEKIYCKEKNKNKCN